MTTEAEDTGKWNNPQAQSLSIMNRATPRLILGPAAMINTPYPSTDQAVETGTQMPLVTMTKDFCPIQGGAKVGFGWGKGRLIVHMESNTIIK